MAGEGKRKRKDAALSKREKRLLGQLLVCLALFAAVFGGRGVDWEPVQRVTAAVESWVQADTDFRAVFARMGESFSNGEPAAETFRALWDGVTGIGDGEAPPQPGETKIV